MKLLLDENLSRHLIPFLQADYPGSSQVSLLGLEKATDREIWSFARHHGFVIVTRDADFSELSTLLGHPPQLVWLRIPNQSKAAVLNLLCSSMSQIEHVLLSDELACIELTSVK